MKIKEIRLPPPFLLLHEPPSPKHSALAFDPRLTHIQPTLSLYHELTFSHDPRPPQSSPSKQPHHTYTSILSLNLSTPFPLSSPSTPLGSFGRNGSPMPLPPLSNMDGGGRDPPCVVCVCVCSSPDRSTTRARPWDLMASMRAGTISCGEGGGMVSFCGYAVGRGGGLGWGHV